MLLPSLAWLSVNCKSSRDDKDQSSNQQEDDGASKKQKKLKKKPKLLPCPDELNYAKDEIINLSEYSRKQGHSSSFSKFPIKDLPIISSDAAAQLDALRESSEVTYSTKKVLNELYRDITTTTTTADDDEPPRPPVRKGIFYGVFVTSGNRWKRQYYTHTLSKDAEVVHIVRGSSSFWYRLDSIDKDKTAQKGDDSDDDDDYNIIKPEDIGRSVYTDGLLWTNTSPNWTWKTPRMRCVITIPKGTQVIVDRSPVNSERCDFDKSTVADESDQEHKRRTVSFFPDVLLLPGQFRISKVTHYIKRDTSSSSSSSSNQDSTPPSPQIGVPNEGNEGNDAMTFVRKYMTCDDIDETTSKKVPSDEPLNDELYASKIIDSEFQDDFFDIRLSLVETVRIPESPA
jgi:hypothetical protein